MHGCNLNFQQRQNLDSAPPSADQFFHTVLTTLFLILAPNNHVYTKISDATPLRQ